LWVISSEDVRYFKDNRPTAINVGTRLGQISHPFMLDGRPAVLEERPGGMSLAVLRERQWERGPLIHFGPENDVLSLVSSIQVFSCGAEIQLFMPFGEVLHHRKGLPAENGSDWTSWDPVAPAPGGWSALCLGSEPVVFLPSQDTFDDALEEYRRVDGSWKRIRTIPLYTSQASLGIVPTGDDSHHFVLSAFAGGSLAVTELRNGEIVGWPRYYRSEAEDRFSRVLKMLAFACLGYLAAPIALALLLSGMMSRWRIPEIALGSRIVVLAPLWKRAFSEVVDTFILGAPLLAGNIALFWRLLQASPMLSRPTMGMGMKLVLFGVVWIVAGLLAFSFMEGRWGVTPGKWILGIRVIGSDSRPCGFLRGLVRNLLRVVDGFFNFMVGLLVTALSENWQRVGDMAARTVVVLARDQPSDGAPTTDAMLPAEESAPAIFPS
ncbi:MAG TPA: RDD family protein, partial [Candidatus Polarisedimenticolia bacterium]|nr:RDD family protein [Candidatus Polarisedimenticolia bacterium]